jgi:hypothetical protein
MLPPAWSCNSWLRGVAPVKHGEDLGAIQRGRSVRRACRLTEEVEDDVAEFLGVLEEKAWPESL